MYVLSACRMVELNKQLLSISLFKHFLFMQVLGTGPRVLNEQYQEVRKKPLKNCPKALGKRCEIFYMPTELALDLTKYNTLSMTIVH